MKELQVLCFLLWSFMLTSQSQLEVQGKTDNSDPVVDIKANYQGAFGAIAIRASSMAMEDEGIGGDFYGGNIGASGFSANGRGLSGISNHGIALHGFTEYGQAVYGDAFRGIGVEGISGTSIGVRGESGDSIGVYGFSTTHTGVAGGSFVGIGVRGSSTTSTGVMGSSTDGNGIEGSAITGIGVEGTSTDNFGLKGVSSGESGVYGNSLNGAGVEAVSFFGYGLQATSANNSGIFAQSTFEYGVEGDSDNADSFDFFADASDGSTAYGQSSSKRWKTNIRNIPDPLSKLEQLRGVYFNWDRDHGGHHAIGFIAEEVGEVLPEIVVYEKNGVDAKGLDYSKLTPLLVEATKAMKKQYEQKFSGQDNRIKALEAVLKQTNAELTELKNLVQAVLSTRDDKASHVEK